MIDRPARILLILLIVALPCVGEGTGEVGSITSVTLAYSGDLLRARAGAIDPVDLIAREFTRRYPLYRFELLLAPDDPDRYHDNLLLWMASGDPVPDLYGLEASWTAEFVAAGWAAPLDGLVVGLREDFDPVGLLPFSVGGRVYGVPTKGRVGVLHQNRQMAQDYGLTTPRTYAEMVAIARRVMADRPETAGYLFAGAPRESLVQTWAELSSGFGANPWMYGVKPKQAKSIEALEFLRDLVKMEVSPEGTLGWSDDQVRQRFMDGDCLFLRASHDMGSVAAVPRSTLGANPARPDGRPAGAFSGLAVALNPRSGQRRAAVDLLIQIAGRDIQKGLALAWGPIQYRRDVTMDPAMAEALPEWAAIRPILVTTAMPPSITHYVGVSRIMRDELHRALRGTIAADRAMEQAASRIAQMLSGEEVREVAPPPGP